MFQKSNLPKGEAYEKPHLIIDFKPIEEAEILLEDCNAFTTQASQNMMVIPFPGLTRIRKWRAKRRDDQLSAMYESLQPRVQESERILRKMIGEVVEKKRALRMQARHLLSRLDACITFNCDMLSLSDTPVVEIRAIVNNLSSASVAVKSMMVFNNEVLRQRNMQSAKQSKSFVPWTKRSAINKPLSENELNTDADHPSLVKRLHELREVSCGFYVQFNCFVHRFH
jgi:hypothetical protein